MRQRRRWNYWTLPIYAVLVLLTSGCSANAPNSAPEPRNIPTSSAPRSTQPGIPSESPPSMDATSPDAQGSTSPPDSSQASAGVPASDPTPTAAPRTGPWPVPGPPDPGIPPVQPGATVLAWVPIGPTNPIDPSDGTGRWLDIIQRKDCKSLAGADSSSTSFPPLWRAISAVCAAVFNGDTSGWKDAASLQSEIPPARDCMEQAVLDVLNRFMAFHQQHPTAPILVVAGTGTACPLKLEGLGTKPPKTVVCVPLGGGTEFRLGGRFLDPTYVILGTTRIKAAFVGENVFTFVVPPALTPGPVVLHVESAGKMVPGQAVVTYAIPSATGEVVCPVPAISSTSPPRTQP